MTTGCVPSGAATVSGFRALGAIAAQWLSSAIWKARLAAAHERVSVFEERLKLAADQSQQSKAAAKTLQTELEGFRNRMQGRIILTPQEVEEGTTTALTHVARLIKQEHDLGETLNKIPIVRASKEPRDERTGCTDFVLLAALTASATDTCVIDPAKKWRPPGR